MANATIAPSSELMSKMETALDNMSEYIGETVWETLHKAFVSTDIDAEQLEEQLEEANERIKELEDRINELEV